MNVHSKPPLSNLQARDLDSVIHPYAPLHRMREMGPLIMSHGAGVWITDTQGNDYIEGMSGLWCAGLGFGNKEMVEAATEQLSTLPYYHQFSGKGTEPAIELSEKLKEVAHESGFEHISKVLFSSSGSEANDTQIKLAWYVNNARGKTGKKKIISRVKAYHGVTMMAASLTGLPNNHREFDLPFDGVIHVDCPHHYRFGHEGESEAEFTDRIVASLAETIEREGADTIAAMIGEPVMGAGGVIVPPADYWPRVSKLLADNDIALISDEVICGFGRTGAWFGAETMGMTPDTLSVAKQLTSAYAPLGAVLLSDEMVEAMEDQSAKIGVFGHGYTYGGHPLGCALGVKAIEIYRRENILGRVKALAPVFAERVHRLVDHPLVGDVRLCGLLGGVEIVADKATRRPFDISQGVGAACAKFLEGHGAILRAIGDTMALCPPMVIAEDELHALFDRLTLALDDTENWVRREDLRG